jgi:4-oxalocrotonate tautomerase
MNRTPGLAEAEYRQRTTRGRLPIRQGEEMPLINVKLIEDVFTPEQKHRIVEELTDAMVAIEGESIRQVTWVVVEEVRSGDWGIAGKPLTTQDVRALAAAPA